MPTVPIFNKEDERIGIISAAVFLLIIALILFLVTYQIADPAPKPYEIPAATEIEEIVLKDLKVDIGGGAQGTPSDDPVSPPKPQTQQVLTKKENPDTKVNSGKGSANTAPNSQNEATNSKKSDNPFGSGGSSTEGNGSVFGKDNVGTSGSGPGGIGDGKGRIRLNDPKTDDISSDDNHTIYLQVTVNSEGRVVDAKSISSRTTTTDQRIINQVIAAVKGQVRYNPKPDAALEVRYETIRLNAN
ncbi:MAG: hypothetical protein KJ941_02845 [Bacteroidetes bacterium]|nr:hypothetical protein [Bacteroidota bacterium]